ncbi:carbohydrate binding domain-containing protein [Catellatospora tritici]|uniref:carbohydrate binding domain-containing protein n=1 Tax=Catellatospora tritici TaxID=2851566 RepID=UPI0027E05B92|nr:carbohydrate binding domain-containing protein [Catellatospora tritici]
MRTLKRARGRWGVLLLAVTGLLASLVVSVPPASAANTVTVFYQPSSTWTTVNIHYAPTGGSWTAVPGVAMDAACTGWRKKTIDLGTATGLQVVFNNGSGTWDNNGGANYALGTGNVTVAGGVKGTGDPCATTAPGNTVTVFYQPSSTWTTVNIHYAPTGGSWTTAPGVAMDAACTGWRKKTIDLGTATGLAATFNNGSGTWDNNGGTNYALGTGNVTVAGGVKGTGDPCATAPPGNKATVFYYTKTRAWTTVNLHWAPTGGSWTTAPGVPMNETACTDWVKKTVDLGTATGLAATFNNNAGTWDNNGGVNYAVSAGTATVRDGVVKNDAVDPCSSVPPDTTAPSRPTDLTATANMLSIALAWTGATDDRGVTGYQVTRTGGAAGSVVFTSTGNAFTDTALAATTTYSYTVKAMDAAGNLSAASAAASATTGTPPPVTSGSMLGGDPRKDSIYFVLTARFYDGDVSNDRGGSQHTKSGNAANSDPMFRGDFSGLIQKLDYIKGLGFSAIWITPVVLNRSDYDYHGYHGYDFFRVDARLESAGASYQDLIDTAHAKGLKIYQDVVYNHSSRWGAKGLFTPKVYGVRDTQWSWYYDVPNPNFTYDGLSIEPTSGKSYYTGDLWSTPEPAGNTCRNWGVFSGFYSAEGYKVYNCQWPSPTSGMFSANLYHQCWIGNWEGEDARSCWLHEDLADFNTENATVQQYLISAYDRFIDMGVDGFRIDTAVHIPRVTWNRRFLPALEAKLVSKYGATKAKDFYVFGEVAAFVNDKWNRGSVNHSAQFFTWKERREYSADDVTAAIEQYNYENTLGTAGQPTSTNAFLQGNTYHAPDRTQFSGMNIIDMRMHMNFGDAPNAFNNGRDSDDSVNDATYNVVYVDSHDYGPNKSSTRYAGGTDAWAENMSLMWTFRGVPTLYYGSEIEFQAGKQIDCGPTCPLATTGRAYYGANVEGTVTAADYGVVSSSSGAVATTLSKPLVKHLQRLNLIRRAIPALQMGQYSTEGVTGSMAYKRRYTSGSVDSFALVTVSGSATFTGVPNGVYTDAVTGTSITVTNGTLTAAASGKGNLRVYVLSLPGNPAPGKIGTDTTWAH